MTAEKVLLVVLVVDDAVWQVMVIKFAKSSFNTYTYTANTCSVDLFGHQAFPAARFILCVNHKA